LTIETVIGCVGRWDNPLEKSRGGSSFADRVEALFPTIVDETFADLECSDKTARTFIDAIRFIGNRSHELPVRCVGGLFTMTSNRECKVDEVIQNLKLMIEDTDVAEQLTELRTWFIAM
jgi:hypothetical protein